MVNRNIQMKKKNNDEWENLFPLSLNENIYNEEGSNLNEQFDQLTLNVNEQFDHLTNLVNDKFLKVNEKTDEPYIKAKYPPKNFEGIKADGVTDDSENLQILIDNFKNIELPNGKILLKNTIKLRGYQNIKGGNNQTILTSDQPDQTILLGNKFEDDTTDFNHSSLKNITIDGMDKNSGQTGINIRGYHSRISNVYLRYLDLPFKLGGVLMDFKQMFIINNAKGGLILSPPTSFNTMLNFRNCQWHSNDDGLKDETANNTVGLHLLSCVFENNKERAFYLRPFSASIEYTWFERNLQAGVIRNQRLFLNKNRYEKTSNYPDQEIVFEERDFPEANETAGNVEIMNSNGVLSLRELQIQNYAPYAKQRPLITLKTVGGDSTQKIAYTDESDHTTRYMMANKELKRTNLYSIRIDPSGSIVHNDFENINVTCEKIDTGEYIVKFGQYMDMKDYNYQITCFNEKSGGVAGGGGSTMFPTYFFRNGFEHQVYPRFTEILIKLYEVNTEGESILVKKDGYFNLLMYAEYKL